LSEIADLAERNEVASQVFGDQFGLIHS
jgi:hypothetical protein